MEGKFFNRNSIFLRLFVIGVLILVLMIPSAMISSLISERESRKREAIGEITSKWAGAQTVGGPVVTIPYENKWKDEKGKIQTEMKFIQVLPQLLAVRGEIKPEIRYRGIYKAVLYNTKIDMEGTFSFDKVESLNVVPDNIKWGDAFAAIFIPDMRGIKEYVELKWNGQGLLLEPGVREGNFFNSGISVKVPLSREAIARNKYGFSVKLDLNGSEEFSLLPLGQRTTLQLTSGWSNPSFAGAFLPEKREVGKEGFKADWKVLDLNRNYPQQWLGNAYDENISGSKFGVSLFSPVDEYTKANRAIKYIFMFVGLTFLIFFLVEVFNKKKIHPMQYLLIGLALCLFYVLLLSLSEHLGFETAYLIACLAVTVLISAYVGTSLRGKALTALTTFLLAVLYGYLYVLLQNQDYALLMGSIGLFVIMAVVMYLTRKIDWYGIEVNN